MEDTEECQATDHWVEELFPATFRKTIEDLSEVDTAEPGIFAQLANRVGPMDVSAIKNVYERVWLMTQLEEEEKKRREEEDKKEESGKELIDTKSDKRLLRSARESYRALRTRETTIDRSITEKDDQVAADVDDSCIWNSKELEVLRSVFKSAKERNKGLTARLKATSEDLEQLQEKYTKQECLLETRTKHLKEAKISNERLHILSINLKSELEKAKQKQLILEKDLKLLLKQKNRSLKENQELKMDFNKERLDRKALEMDIEEHTRKMCRELAITEEEMKLRHQVETAKLFEKIDGLEKKLEAEKQDHQRTKRGLEHLRQHFSSLSLSGENNSSGSASKNQLNQWSY